MEIRDLDRIRFFTRHFNDLQGLRYGVPLGLITLAWGGPLLLRLAALAGALLLTLAARWYYRVTFGEVQRQPIDPIADLYPVSVFSPAGRLSRLEGFRQVPSVARHFLATVALAMALFTFFQSIPPNFLVEGDEALGQHPQVRIETTPFLGPPLIKVLDGAAVRPPSMRKAVFAQTMYVLYGSFFLGLWLWRRHRLSQSHHLVPAVLLLGLAALGTSLGYVARGDGEIARSLDPVLPALVYPGMALLLCGSSMLLTGLLDHWQLVRALRPATQEVEEP